MSTPANRDLGLSEARHLAADMFLLGFPLVLMDVIRRAHPVELNQVLRLADDSAALAPGLSDEGARTVRASAWIDVSGGPVILHLPHMHGRYFSLSLIDGTGRLFASLGSRTGDGAGRDLVLAPPRWRGAVADGLKARRLTGDLAWAIGRLTANSMADRPDTEALAARLSVTSRRPSSEPQDGSTRGRILEAPGYGSLQQVLEMHPGMFGHRLNLLIGRDAAKIPTRLEQLNDLGREASGDAGLNRALLQGFADAAAAIRAGARLISAPSSNGWRAFNAPADASGGVLAAAVRAFVDLGGPAAQDVLSLGCETDEAGRDLSGAERYRIHFPRGSTPPVQAFWSLFAAPRAARGGRRRGISDRNELTRNPDGSLDLILQRDAPTHGAAVNWLPSPSEAFTLHMRLHWPKPEALSGDWLMPAVERLGSGFARRAENRLAEGRGAEPRAVDWPDDLHPAQPAWR